LGGTCVNVGCIPKKIMHYTALLGASKWDQKELGWGENQNKFDWDTLTQTVKNHIGSLNFGYRKSLRENKVTYVNAYAVFVDPHTVEYTELVNKQPVVKRLSAAHVLIAVGGRPRYPEIPGAKEFGITSDDIFSLKQAPGKTLCVGAACMIYSV
jgi:thioredoxin reductase (NADPH)